jgi:hypothetical protein
MTADPFAGRLLVGPMIFRRAADQADLGTISYDPKTALPFKAVPKHKPVGAADPAPVASLDEALALLDAFAPPLSPTHLPIEIVDRQPSTILATYADGRVLDGLLRGDVPDHARPHGAGKGGRIHAILHRRHCHQATGSLYSRDDIGGVKRLPDGRWWAWYDDGGRRMPTLKSGIAWIHECHLDAVGASAHARIAFANNLASFLVALAD